VDSLLKQGDYYLLLADFASYMECQERVSRTYLDPDQWSQKAIINVARMGKFSSDRSIKEYAEQIWQARSVPIE
jgi:starch phosphorylase